MERRTDERVQTERKLTVIAHAPEISHARRFSALTFALCAEKPRRGLTVDRVLLYWVSFFYSALIKLTELSRVHTAVVLLGEYAASCMPVNSAPECWCKSDGYMSRQFNKFSTAVQDARTSSLLAGKVFYWAFLCSH